MWWPKAEEPSWVKSSSWFKRFEGTTQPITVCGVFELKLKKTKKKVEEKPHPQISVPKWMGHLYLSFALSVSGDLTTLANQLEELLPWIIHRSEMYYALAFCYYGAGKDLVALDLYFEYEIGVANTGRRACKRPMPSAPLFPHINHNSFVHLLNLMQLDLRTNVIADDQQDDAPLQRRWCFLQCRL
ncbi:unnamed protein product [Sphenostylis stenocarpa]|uniref:Uncharacterized protein n=1 Tax=Sphenostylis stenocarpa TaxID=92480 RepID=A0AA86S693_9FABA|nr:unnamed protein product [Sphenostylis stenocarpa]